MGPVTSIRTVQWDSMKPNFYMAFPPDGGLTDMPATWITAFYLNPDNKLALNDFSRQFPTVSVLEIDHIIDRIQGIFFVPGQIETGDPGGWHIRQTAARRESRVEVGLH